MKKLVKTILIGGVVSMAVQNASAAPKWMKKGNEYEKCKGVAAKGANDCGANTHKCAGFAKTNFDANEWVYTPKGTCETLAVQVLKNGKPTIQRGVVKMIKKL
jgi:uncharacterized membrane protein